MQENTKKVISALWENISQTTGVQTLKQDHLYKLSWEHMSVYGEDYKNLWSDLQFYL